MSETTYVGAIRDALFEEMERDERVVVIGEDVGHFGGAFKATAGLFERFGAERVIDTPIAEGLILGVAIGAAIRGLKPVAEMQFADFVACGFSQLAYNASTFHYRLGVSVPLVVRLPAGGSVGGGPFHSKDPESWFANTPGLKIVAPATPADAKALLLEAIRDPDPVIYLEQKYLYRREKGPVDGDEGLPFGRARIARAGRHATIVTYGNTVSMSLEAAEAVAADGFDVEVLDLRTLVPWDWRTVVTSVAKTGRALVVHEATRTGGFGGEIAATIADLAFDRLDAPVRRVAALDTPTPAERSLEQWVLPDAAKIERALRELMAY